MRLAAALRVRALIVAGLLVFASGPAFCADVTDSAGRTVHVPDHVTHIVPAGPPADVLLYALAPDLLAGLVEPWRADQIGAVPEAYRGSAKCRGLPANCPMTILSGFPTAIPT
ncbi:hypothetical protein [Methylovirgula sp. 4M-Z18]|uniref:hypothetical protein n=1 Tax=Methylovirgula sp. 4M-Z18 TaxID=2293567 RepID=UPI0013145B7B|nr:hypothetical protein [Methylovirgula sp. 4M-Z18]